MAPSGSEALVISLDSDDDVVVASSTPATLIPATPKSRPVGLPLSPEAQKFLGKLCNYIPVGCLITSLESHSDALSGRNKWEEIKDASILPGYQQHFLADFQKLLIYGWIRVFSTCNEFHQIFRVFVLPGDVGHRYVDHSNKVLSRALHVLVRELDISPRTWNGHTALNVPTKFDTAAALDEGSLYFMFNTLPSPAPSIDRVKSYFHRKALTLLLDKDCQVPGLRTRLYPYQRRSAGLMLEREVEVRLELDPRLEQRIAPDGTMYYYGPRSTAFFKSPRLYETSRGGVLAETMGLGKTLMCIALILSTKGCLPKVPTQYDIDQKRPRIGSLTQMAASAINRHSAPWKPYFEEVAAKTGEHMSQCIDIMRQSATVYEIPTQPIRWNRNTAPLPPKRLVLAPTTLLVVPRNLFMQWKSELHKHIDGSSLEILFMDDPRKPLPSTEELVLYDLVVFSRPRFEQESKDGSDSQGRRKSRYPVSCQCPYIGATRDRDCTCLRDGDIYDTPLKHIHFLRVIIDEGHFFSSSKTQAARVANDLVRADHRWVVTGTPAKDLLGTEMEIAADSVTLPDEEQRQEALEQRKHFKVEEDTIGAVKSIGDLVSHFLKIRPWTACEEERSAEWKFDIYRQEHAAAQSSIVGFSRCLRRTLENVVVKTRPNDVERDIELPPLEHKTVRLSPSFYDKLTANTFAFVLTANAVTSERTDTDYLFHPNSRQDRNKLVDNLRHSAFAWTGFSEADIEATIKNSEGYLEKENTMCSEADRALLKQCVAEAKHMLVTPGWLSLSRTHEVGLLVEKWPEDSAPFWSFGVPPSSSNRPILCGVTQLLKAQSHVNERAGLADPSEGLSGAGLRALLPAKKVESVQSMFVKSGIPSSSVNKQSGHHHLPGTTDRTSPSTKIAIRETPGKSRSSPKNASTEASQSSPANVCQELPPTSTLRRTMIKGTTSAKLTYLLSRIDQLHQEEKILIFYDSDDAAYYIAQALDVMHIHHFIYAKGLTSAKKSEYIVGFDKDPNYRVLLMDVGQAAFGLNVPSASRVFFLNPVCQPQVEAQAIKRAHRIGQTRKVVVETLVLEGTLEEQMFERAKRMTRAEHSDAKMLDDDGGIKDIIQHVRPLPILDREIDGEGQVTQLEQPQQLWSRPNWPSWKKIQDKILGGKKTSKRQAAEQISSTGPRKKQRKVSEPQSVDATDLFAPGILVDAVYAPRTSQSNGLRSSNTQSITSAKSDVHQNISIFGG